jgi:hypothetical protein
MNSIIIVKLVVIYLFGLLSGLIISYLTKPKCNHKWKQIKEGYLNDRYVTNIGYTELYRCDHCLELKRNTIYFD